MFWVAEIIEAIVGPYRGLRVAPENLEAMRRRDWDRIGRLAHAIVLEEMATGQRINVRQAARSHRPG